MLISFMRALRSRLSHPDANPAEPAWASCLGPPCKEVSRCSRLLDLAHRLDDGEFHAVYDRSHGLPNCHHCGILVREGGGQFISLGEAFHERHAT